MDKNKSGTLKADDLVKVLSITGSDPLTQEEILELCNACGRSSSDEVNINDISKLLNSMDELNQPTQMAINQPALCTRAP